MENDKRYKRLLFSNYRRPDSYPVMNLTSSRNINNRNLHVVPLLERIYRLRIYRLLSSSNFPILFCAVVAILSLYFEWQTKIVSIIRIRSLCISYFISQLSNQVFFFLSLSRFAFVVRANYNLNATFFSSSVARCYVVY